MDPGPAVLIYRPRTAARQVSRGMIRGGVKVPPNENLIEKD